MDEIRKRRFSKPYLRFKSKEHLKTFIRLFLESINGNSIDLSKIVAFANTVWREVESDNICYLKRMPNGRIRVFRELHCCCPIEDWKNCPEYNCPAWPLGRGLACPYNEHTQDENNFALELGVDISFKNNKQGKHSGADKKESPD